MSLNIGVEIQIKLGHDKAASCFSYISPSTLWISDKFGTYGKVYSRRIQRLRLQDVWRRTRRGRRILPGDEPIGTDKGYYCFTIPDGRSPDFPPTRHVFSLNSQSILVGFRVFCRLER